MFKYIKQFNSTFIIMKIYPKILFCLFLFILIDSSLQKKETFGNPKSSEYYRINIITAKSFHNAEIISEKLNKLFKREKNSTSTAPERAMIMASHARFAL